MKTRRTEIVIESARVIVISKPRRLLAWCAGCRQEVDWLTVDEAARLAGSSSRRIFHLVEDGTLHFMETRDGMLAVCPDSLRRAAAKAQSSFSQVKEEA